MHQIQVRTKLNQSNIVKKIEQEYPLAKKRGISVSLRPYIFLTQSICHMSYTHSVQSASQLYMFI